MLNVEILSVCMYVRMARHMVQKSRAVTTRTGNWQDVTRPLRTRTGKTSRDHSERARNIGVPKNCQNAYWDFKTSPELSEHVPKIKVTCLGLTWHCHVRECDPKMAAESSSSSGSSSTSSKSVLVCLGESKKQVSFECCEDADEEKKAFTDAMLYEFSDVLPSPSPPLIIQLKDERWEGEFLDLSKKAKIPHHTVVRVILGDESAKVRKKSASIVHFNKFTCIYRVQASLLKDHTFVKKWAIYLNIIPGSSVSGGTRKRVFDPHSESVVSSNQRKKKAAFKTVRPVTREVIVLSEYTLKLPKSACRQKLREMGVLYL